MGTTLAESEPRRVKDMGGTPKKWARSIIYLRYFRKRALTWVIISLEMRVKSPKRK